MPAWKPSSRCRERTLAVRSLGRLRAADWDIQGTVVDTGRPVTVHDLVLVSLHHSHRDLALLTTSSVAVRFC